MKLVLRMILVAAMAVATLGTVSAQRPGGGGGGGFVPSAYGAVGTNEELQKELKISDEQKKKLKEAMEPINKKRMELIPRGQGGQQPTEEQRKERTEKMAKLTEETKAAIGTVLNAEQAKRLGQIDYQMMGMAAYSDADVQKKMSFTDAQKETVKATVEAYQKDRAELMKDVPRGGRQPSEEDQKKFADLRKKGVALGKEAEEKIVAVLTDDQKKIWTDMIGEKVDVSKFSQFGGQRRPMTN
jgi:hypothetical protein